MRFWSPFVALLLVVSAPVEAQEGVDPRAAEVDRLFAEWDRPGSPGAAVAVVQNGEMVYARGYGRATLEYDVPITPSTVFHVASVSKQFTAYAVALLAEEGRLSLDDDVRDHLPDVPDFGERITVRHLIHHTSGLRDQWELLMAAGWRIDDVITQDQILSLVRRQRELNFPPGSAHLYSNTGYTLMAEIVSGVTGQPFSGWMEENVFGPLGMDATHFHDDHRRIVPGRAYSYAQRGGEYVNAPLNYATVGATSLFTTAEDLATWTQHLDAMAQAGSAVHAMMRERGVLANGDTLSYAFALTHGTHRGEPTLQHGGSDAGYRSYLAYLPDRRLGVVVLSNLATFDPAGLAMGVLDVFLGHEPSPPAAPPLPEPEVALSVDELRPFTGQYLLASGMRIDVTSDGRERLLVRFGGGDPTPASAISGGRFVLRDRGHVFAFDRSETGEVTGLVADIGGRSVAGTRLLPLDPAVLEPYVGLYRSDELGTSYELVIRDGHLVAEHRRHPPSILAPAGRDRFVGDRWGMGTLEFSRDDHGVVTGFRLSGSRVLNLRFDRVP